MLPLSYGSGDGEPDHYPQVIQLPANSTLTPALAMGCLARMRLVNAVLPVYITGTGRRIIASAHYIKPFYCYL